MVLILGRFLLAVILMTSANAWAEEITPNALAKDSLGFNQYSTMERSILFQVKDHPDYLQNFKNMVRIPLKSKDKTVTMSVYPIETTMMIGTVGWELPAGAKLLQIPYSAVHGLIAGNVVFMSYLFFNVEGPYRYPAYPFASDTSFLLREKGRNWFGSLSVISLGEGQNNTRYQTEIFVDRRGLEVQWASLNGRQKTNLGFSYRFAQNDFMMFRVGVGLERISQTAEDGLNLSYEAQLFYEPISATLRWNIGTTFKKTLSEELSLSLGYHIGPLEFGVGVIDLRILQDRYYGPQVFGRVWF